MPENRFYTSHISEGETVDLIDREHHHLFHVMRKKPGDQVELVDGDGSLGIAKILFSTKAKTSLELLSVQKQKPPQHPLRLIQAMPRLPKLDLILEKGTELGMDEIWLFPSQKSEKMQFSENQKVRMHQILISAMKQCGRLFCPKILLMPAMHAWDLSLLGKHAYFGDTDASAPLFYDAWHKPDREVSFVIGPEGGFSSQEKILLTSYGMRGVLLNSNTLRTETAAIAAISLMAHLLEKRQ